VNPDAEKLVRELRLVPHPEGGYYREIFRSPETIVTARADHRNALTVIYFLLADSQISAWHRLRSDETWHFARGDELEIARIDGAGHMTTLHLGPNGPHFAAIPAGRPFAARLHGGAGFALVTCCVAPGFDFDDFEMLDAGALALANPECAEAIASYASHRPERVRGA
jgi:predicted cupin superfamily sugar epimerase